MAYWYDGAALAATRSPVIDLFWCLIKFTTTTTTTTTKPPPTFSSKVRKVKIMIINCNGVKGLSKQTAFLATLDIHRPDIVLECESKLCNSMCSYELFPKNYAIFRKDRNVNGGGVFVATSDRIISYEIPDIDTDCEIILAGSHFSGSKPLYLANF